MSFLWNNLNLILKMSRILLLKEKRGFYFYLDMEHMEETIDLVSLGKDRLLLQQKELKIF